MRTSIRLLVICVALAAPQMALGQAQDDHAQQVHEYDRYLQEYDRRVEEQKEEQKAFSAQQLKRFWAGLGVVFGLLVVYGVYIQSATRRRLRRVQEIMDKSRAEVQKSVDRSIQQNQRMIELLESIDHKLDRQD